MEREVKLVELKDEDKVVYSGNIAGNIKTEDEEIELLLEENRYIADNIQQPVWQNIRTDDIKVEIVTDENGETVENEMVCLQPLDEMEPEGVALEVEIVGDETIQSDGEYVEVGDGAYILASDLLKADEKVVEVREKSNLTLKQYYQKISSIIDTDESSLKTRVINFPYKPELANSDQFKKSLARIANVPKTKGNQITVIQGGQEIVYNKIGRPRKHPVKERKQEKRGRPRVEVRKKKKSYYVRKREPAVNTGFSETFENGMRRYTCDTCGYSSKYSFNLRKHYRSVHLGERPFQCDQCDKRFSLKSDLTKHIGGTHMAIKPFPCPHCDYRSGCKHTLRIHIEFLHMKEKKYKCQFCDYSSPLKRHIREHIRSRHTFEKPFHCTLCNFKGITKQTLKTHIQRVHLQINQKKKSQVTKTPVALLNCHLCDYSTQYNSKLQFHINNVHLNNKPFKCDKCQYTTNYSKSLRNHARKTHQLFEGFFCHFCNKKYNFKKSLKKHIFYNHMADCLYQCAQCDFRCINKLNLVSHNKLHSGDTSESNTCDTADESKYREHILKQYSRVVKVNNLKRYQCTECNHISDSYSMCQHINGVHLKRKPYLCSFCSYKSTKKYHLKAHIFRKHPGKNYNVTNMEFFNIELEKDKEVEVNTEDDVYLNFCEVDENFDKNQNDCLILERDINHELIKCPQCSFTSFSQSQLACHISTKHFKINPYICCYCDFGTGNVNNLRDHIAQEHPSEKFRMIEIKMEPNEINEDVFEITAEDLGIKSEELFDVQITDLAALNKFETSKGENINGNYSGNRLSHREMYYCSYCDYSNRYKSCFEKHVRTVHMKLRPFICSYCGFKSSSKHSLKLHIKNKHPGGEEKTSMSGSESLLDSTLNDSKPFGESNMVYYDQKAKCFECELCDFKHKMKCNVDLHIMRTHLRYEQYLCVFCGFKTTQKVNLKMHIYRKHFGKCYQKICVEMDDEICEALVWENGDITSGSSDMNIDIDSNETNTSPNMCKNIQQSPNTRKNSSESSNIMTCQKCDFTTSDKLSLKRHELTHQGKKPFRCLLCSFQGSSVDNLKSHILRKHPEESHLNEFIEKYIFVESSELKCTLCDYISDDKETLETHKTSHLDTLPLFCPHCGGCFGKEDSLKHHVKFAHSGLLKCPLCDFNTKLENALITHVFEHDE